jgi:hypothetical protein
MDTTAQCQVVEFIRVGRLEEADLEPEAVGKGGDQVVVEAAAPLPWSWKKAGASRIATISLPSASGGSMRPQPARTSRGRQQIRRSSFGKSFPPYVL